MRLSDQAQASASVDAAAVMSALTGLMEEEKALIQCKNRKEAIEYEVKIKKIVSTSLKHFQKGTEPDPGDPELGTMYPMMVQEMKRLVGTVFDHVTKANWKAIIQTVTNPDGECIWNPEIMDDDDDDDNGEGQAEVKVQ